MLPQPPKKMVPCSACRIGLAPLSATLPMPKEAMRTTWSSPLSLLALTRASKPQVHHTVLNMCIAMPVS